MDNFIKEITENRLNCKVLETEKIGKGASAEIYRVKTDKPPFTLAVKYSKFPDLITEEYDALKFISERVECKLPRIYAFIKEDNFGLLIMEYISGKGVVLKNLRFKFGKRKLADEITDNLIKIHNVHNDKFGPVNNAVYATWSDYYSEFAKEIYEFTRKCKEEGKVPSLVFEAVEKSYKNLSSIIEDNGAKPSLIHGDYWVPNLLVDTETMELKGVVDPFNIMWTEPEYELFALTVGYGKNLKLYENYKKKVKTSRLCDLKIELYALYNELFWFTNTGKVSKAYLVYRSRRLLKQMKKNKII